MNNIKTFIVLCDKKNTTGIRTKVTSGIWTQRFLGGLWVCFPRPLNLNTYINVWSYFCWIIYLLTSYVQELSDSMELKVYSVPSLRIKWVVHESWWSLLRKLLFKIWKPYQTFHPKRGHLFTRCDLQLPLIHLCLRIILCS